MTRKVQTPGDQPPKDTADDNESGIGHSGQVGPDPEPTELSNAELMEVVRKQAEQLRNLTATVSGLARAAGPSPSAGVAEAELPDQSTIDVTKITTPVLSKQGWVVPPTFGSNPAAPKA